MESLQIKLAMDEGLSEIWGQLQTRYKGLGKSGIVRLALNDLAGRSEEKKYDYLLQEVLDEIDSRKEGMTEEEFANWWNENKKSIIE